MSQREEHELWKAALALQPKVRPLVTTVGDVPLEVSVDGRVESPEANQTESPPING